MAPTLPPLVGNKYTVKHFSLGTFIGECTETNSAWSAFRVIDGNSELAAIDTNPGDVIELTTAYYRATEIASQWNRQPE